MVDPHTQALNNIASEMTKLTSEVVVVKTNQGHINEKLSQTYDKVTLFIDGPEGAETRIALLEKSEKRRGWWFGAIIIGFISTTGSVIAGWFK